MELEKIPTLILANRLCSGQKKSKVCLVAVLIILALPVLAQAIEIPTNSDFRYRDINGVAFGPVIESDNQLEVFVSDDGT